MLEQPLEPMREIAGLESNMFSFYDSLDINNKEMAFGSLELKLWLIN